MSFMFNERTRWKADFYVGIFLYLTAACLSRFGVLDSLWAHGFAALLFISVAQRDLNLGINGMIGKRFWCLWAAVCGLFTVGLIIFTIVEAYRRAG